MSEVKRWHYYRPHDGYNFVCVPETGEMLGKEAALILASDYDALVAENERLRAALERISAWNDGTAMRNVARAALAAGSET